MNPSNAATELDVEVNGITLHYEAWGTFSTPERAVILIHGITSNCKAWAVLGPALAAQGWYAIAVDLRGRGQSAKPAHGYGIPFHANDLLALADALELPRVALVGHSLGALIALWMAALHPDRVSRVAFVDAGGKVPEDALQSVAASVKRIGTGYPSLEAYLDQQRQSPVYQWNDLWEQYYRYDALVHSDGTVTSRMPQHALAEEVGTNATIRTEILPDFVRAPALIVRATVGTIAPDRGFILPREEAERIRDVMKEATLVEIPNTNHYTLILSDEFQRAVSVFLAE